MEFLRRLFGKAEQNSTGAGSTGRRSHVTPSRAQRVNMPIAEAPPEPKQAMNEAEPPQETTAAPATEARRLEGSTVDAAAPPEPELAQVKSAADGDTALEPAPPEAPDAGGLPAPKAQPSRIPTPKPILTRQRQSLTYGISSDVGILRHNNEDACFGMHWHSITVDDRPDFGLFIVADGMGGHLDGERASGVAVQTLAAAMLDSIYVPMLKDFDAGSSPTIMEALVKASEAANRAVIKRVPGGGTTLSAVAIVGNLAYLVHVGDSRAYLMHENKIELLTTDHTLVQRLIAMKELTVEEAEHYPQKNVLYRAIGQNEQLKMERLIRPLPPGSQVLLCTDGLWDLVDEDSILEVAMDANSPQAACDRLVRIANDRGGIDNISVIVFQVPGDQAAT